MFLKKLKLKAFKSYITEQVIDFESIGKGLCFVTGENTINQRLGSNDSGKSNLFDAICWVFYGKTSRGLKAGNVHSWGSNEITKVEVSYIDVFGKSRTLVRTWNPTGCYFVEGRIGKPAGEAEILSTIRIPYQAFLHSVYFHQYSGSFFELKPAIREKVFSELLFLDFWLNLSNLASKHYLKYNRIVEKKKLEIQKILGEYETLERTDYSESINLWQKDQDERINRLQDKLARFEKQNEVRGQQVVLKSKEILKQKEKQKLYDKKAERLYNKIKKIEEALPDVIRSKSDITAKLRYLEKQYKTIYGLVSGKCPVCKQVVSRKHARDEQINIEKELEELQKESKWCADFIQHASNRKTELYEERRNYQIESRKATEIIYVLTSEIDALASSKSEIDQEKRFLLEDIEQVRLGRNPFIKKRLELLKELELVKFKLNSAIVLTQVQTEKQSIYKYWVNGFKDVRLYLIQKAIEQLEFEVNDIIQQIGLMDWKIYFTTTKTDRNNNVTGTGFMVYVQAPGSTNKVPFESWSGGVSQRLKIAMQVGLASLIESNYGSFFGLEIWDEPSTFLSENGVYELLDFLKARARETNKQVWLIDHNELEYNGFDQFITIKRKQDIGSIVEVQ